jgi:hypothetical protein
MPSIKSYLGYPQPPTSQALQHDHGHALCDANPHIPHSASVVLPIPSTADTPSLTSWPDTTRPSRPCSVRCQSTRAISRPQSRASDTLKPPNTVADIYTTSQAPRRTANRNLCLAGNFRDSKPGQRTHHPAAAQWPALSAQNHLPNTVCGREQATAATCTRPMKPVTVSWPAPCTGESA